MLLLQLFSVELNPQATTERRRRVYAAALRVDLRQRLVAYLALGKLNFDSCQAFLSKLDLAGI